MDTNFYTLEDLKHNGYSKNKVCTSSFGCDTGYFAISAEDADVRCVKSCRGAGFDAKYVFYDAYSRSCKPVCNGKIVVSTVHDDTIICTNTCPA